jgi:hypothetical protein
LILIRYVLRDVVFFWIHLPQRNVGVSGPSRTHTAAPANGGKITLICDLTADDLFLDQTSTCGGCIEAVVEGADPQARTKADQAWSEMPDGWCI